MPLTAGYVLTVILPKLLLEDMVSALLAHFILFRVKIAEVRMGLIGLRELRVKRNEKKLRATAMLEYSVPFSCVIDGIQVATKCTIGNKKLRLRSSSGITARFELQRGEQVTVAVNPAAFEELKNEFLVENVPPEEVRKLAQLVASMPEEELFIIRRR